MIYRIKEVKVSDISISQYNEARQAKAKESEDFVNALATVGYKPTKAEIKEFSHDDGVASAMKRVLTDKALANRAKKIFDVSANKSFDDAYNSIIDAIKDLAETQNNTEELLEKFKKATDEELKKINDSIGGSFKIEKMRVINRTNVAVTDIEELSVNDEIAKCFLQIRIDAKKNYDENEERITYYQLMAGNTKLTEYVDVDELIEKMKAMNVFNSANDKLSKAIAEAINKINKALDINLSFDAATQTAAAECFYLTKDAEKQLEEARKNSKIIEPQFKKSQLKLKFTFADDILKCYIDEADDYIMTGHDKSNQTTVDEMITYLKAMYVNGNPDSETMRSMLASAGLNVLNEAGQAVKETGKSILKSMTNPGKNHRIRLGDAKTYCLKCTFKLCQADEPDEHGDKYAFEVVDVTPDSSTYNGCMYCVDPILKDDGSVDEESTSAECVKEILKDFANAECIDIREVVDTCCHDSAEHEFTCCLCGQKVIGHGNNPYPLKDKGECCDACNFEKVIPAKLKGVKS